MEAMIPSPSRREWNSKPIPRRVQERAGTRWEADGDCWISAYSVASHGYAQVGWNDGQKNHMVLAHRASWEYAMGPVPLGFTLDHQCKQKTCVNPAHLRILSNYENARRTAGRDWPLGQCANGHPNSDTYTQPSGKRVCRPCKKQWYATHAAKQEAA